MEGKYYTDAAAVRVSPDATPLWRLSRVRAWLGRAIGHPITSPASAGAYATPRRRFLGVRSERKRKIRFNHLLLRPWLHRQPRAEEAGGIGRATFACTPGKRERNLSFFFPPSHDPQSSAQNSPPSGPRWFSMKARTRAVLSLPLSGVDSSMSSATKLARAKLAKLAFASRAELEDSPNLKTRQ